MRGIVKTSKLSNPVIAEAGNMWHRIYGLPHRFYNKTHTVYFDQLNQTNGKEFLFFKSERKKKK